MRFEFLRKQVYRSREKEPRYHITPSGRIRFNRLAANQCLLPVIGDSEFVMLGYDASTQEIAIVPVSKVKLESDRTIIPFKVVTVAGGKRRSIPAKRFFDRLGLVLPNNGYHGIPKVEFEEGFGKCLTVSIAPTAIAPAGK